MLELSTSRLHQNALMRRSLRCARNVKAQTVSVAAHTSYVFYSSPVGRNETQTSSDDIHSMGVQACIPLWDSVPTSGHQTGQQMLQTFWVTHQMTRNTVMYSPSISLDPHRSTGFILFNFRCTSCKEDRPPKQGGETQDQNPKIAPTQPRSRL